MGRLSEYGRHTQEAVKGAIARDRDPVVPRGAVVEREESAPNDLRQAVEKILLCHRLQYVEDADQEGNGYPLLDALSIGSDDVAPGRLEIELLADAIADAVGERIRALEEERDALSARLSRLRPVVESAIVAAREGEGQPDTVRSNALDLLNLDALTPEDRAWAEGEGEGET